MNDKIKELAEAAGFKSYIKNNGSIGWVGDVGTFIPKFTELLVKECIDCVDDLIEPDPYGDTVAEDLYTAHNYALKQAMKHISNRFGIELRDHFESNYKKD
jgi:hypothetical protein